MVGKETPSCWSCCRSSPPGFISLLPVRWEEERYKDGVKWKSLEHNGPYFPPEYEPLPDNVNFFYNGQFGFILVLIISCQ